jgi:nucleoid DNA-binding protein
MQKASSSSNRPAPADRSIILKFNAPLLPAADAVCRQDRRRFCCADEVTDCLAKGEALKLSSFGSFIVRKKGQRLGRNPKNGIEVSISPRRVLVFEPSAILKRRINSDTSDRNALSGGEPAAYAARSA